MLEKYLNITSTIEKAIDRVVPGNIFGGDSELADRFVEWKIAEQNMYSVGVGLSAAGKIPFCSTFSKFITRGYDQIEMAINSGANIKIVINGAGASAIACSNLFKSSGVPNQNVIMCLSC